ncbi:unnamed protein product [Rhizophagus irregularis]|nr:unnamed protein product [Rhizophagus irregularis]
MFNANEEFHKKTTLRFFAKAYEYKCSHINKNGKRCNGGPILGELTQNDQNNTIDECFIVRPNNARSDECRQHNHPPPPPRKTPYNIKAQLQRIIDNEYILDLTARKFLTGSMIQSYLI